MDAYLRDVELLMQKLYRSLNERDRRRYAAIEAAKFGHGRQDYVARILGCDLKTLRRGIDELLGAEELSNERQRQTRAGENH